MEIPEDIKKILIAVDQMLESLPEEEVDKFINSPEFPLYKKVMNQIYGIQEEPELEAQQETETEEPTQEQSGPEIQPVKPPAPVHAVQPAQAQGLDANPLKLKQPIERLKKPTFSLERDIEHKEIERNPEVVSDIEKDYGSQLQGIGESKEAQELTEFSHYLRSRKPAPKLPGTEDERKLVEYVNQQIARSLREIDVRSALTKVGWGPDVLIRVFEIAKDIRVREGKQQVKKHGVEFM